MIRRARLRRSREPTITLINIVFLMLVFFLVAGTLSRPLDLGLNLVRTADLDGRAPVEALVVHADGRWSWQGRPVPAQAAFLADLPAPMRETARLLPDRDLPAATLIALGRSLRAAGSVRVVIVTERGLE